MAFLWGLLALGVHLLSWAGACHALLHKRDPRAALGWVGICFLAPLAGPLLYVFFGIARVDSRATKLMGKAAVAVMGGLTDLMHGFLAPQPRGFVPHDQLPDPFLHLAGPGHVITGRNVVGGNTVEPLYNGEEAYPAMLQAMAGARERVYLSSFIFSYHGGKDVVGAAFADVLIDAARRGLDVRLLVDGVGSLQMSGPWKRLMAAGVQVTHFLPPSILPPQFFINLRTHRKLLVCDGLVGFTGGMNISAQHLVRTQKIGRVQDVHFRCVGPIVSQLQTAFLMDWDFATGNAAHSPLDTVEADGDSLCRILMDGPGQIHEPIHDLFCGMISTAQQSICIMSPYFLPTHALSGALISAALRGVRVDVVLPELNNHRLVDWAMQHQLPPLADKGVFFWYQPPPFTHTKLMLIDGSYTLMGSANLDPRSLELNFELVMEVFDTRLCGKLTRFFHEVRARARPLSADAPLPSLPVRLRNAASWIFSPYL